MQSSRRRKASCWRVLIFMTSERARDTKREGEYELKHIINIRRLLPIDSRTFRILKFLKQQCHLLPPLFARIKLQLIIRANQKFQKTKTHMLAYKSDELEVLKPPARSFEKFFNEFLLKFVIQRRNTPHPLPLFVLMEIHHLYYQFHVNHQITCIH